MDEEEVLDIIDEEEETIEEEPKEEKKEVKKKEKPKEEKKEDKKPDKKEDKKPAVIIPPTEEPPKAVNSSALDEISPSVTDEEIAYYEKVQSRKKVIVGILIFLLLVDLLVLGAYLIGFDRIFTFIK